MPLKLNIAMSRKVGTANYGSRGATVGLETETDSRLVDQPSELHERIAELFRLAAEAINRQLESQPAERTPQATSDRCAASPDNPIRPATANQVRAIHAIANRRNIDLAAELHRRFGLERVDHLTRDEASLLIDSLNASVNGVAAES